jgi:hypothetical protein
MGEVRTSLDVTRSGTSPTSKRMSQRRAAGAGLLSSRSMSPSELTELVDEIDIATEDELDDFLEELFEDSYPMPISQQN